MHTPGAKEASEASKEHNPVRWLQVEAKVLDDRIKEFNETADEHGQNVIVAFYMTRTEREEFLEGFIKGVEDEV